MYNQKFPQQINLFFSGGDLIPQEGSDVECALLRALGGWLKGNQAKHTEVLEGVPLFREKLKLGL